MIVLKFNRTIGALLIAIIAATIGAVVVFQQLAMKTENRFGPLMNELSYPTLSF